MKRTVKTASFIAALCMAVFLLCSCTSQSKVTFTSNEVYGKVTAVSEKSITIEVGQNANLFARVKNGFMPQTKQQFPGFGSGEDNPGMPIQPPTDSDGNFPTQPDAKDDVTASDGTGFTEQENREGMFGGKAFGQTEGSFSGSGVCVEIVKAANVKIQNSNGDSAEVKVGDIVKITLNTSSEAESIEIQDAAASAEIADDSKRKGN